MLYTKKGDDGTTKFLGCDQRFSKSSLIAEALGDIDELNSFLGFCKVKVKDLELKVLNQVSFYELIHQIQKNLFIIQAEVAGNKESITEEKVKYLENIIDDIEKEIPPITKFIIYGGSEIPSLLDWGRAISRRAERRVVAVKEENKVVVSENTSAYLNRLSSLLYGLARLSAYKFGINRSHPDYK